MRVFVTGGSGWVGSALLSELTARGHDVLALARSTAAANALHAHGVEVLRGSLADVDVLAEGAAKSDGVVHLAFIHDFTQYEDANETDREAIDAMGAALAGSDRPLVIASGVATTAVGRPATEDDPPTPDFPRSAAAINTLAWAERGVRSSVVRLPPTTHGRGDRGFIPMIIDIARKKRTSGYVGDGTNVWPAVHRDDAARVFRLALDQAPPASVWHAVADRGVPTRTIAEIIGRHIGVPVASIDADAAVAHFGWIGAIWAADLATSSDRTRRRLGWQPTGPGLVEDLETGHYFET